MHAIPQHQVAPATDSVEVREEPPYFDKLVKQLSAIDFRISELEQRTSRARSGITGQGPKQSLNQESGAKLGGAMHRVQEVVDSIDRRLIRLTADIGFFQDLTAMGNEPPPYASQGHPNEYARD